MRACSRISKVSLRTIFSESMERMRVLAALGVEDQDATELARNIRV